jgi:hypothetical protein
MSTQKKRQDTGREGLRRVQRIWSSSGFVKGLVLLLLFIPGASWAEQMEDSWIARFDAPEQSMWSPGGPAVISYTDGVNWNSGAFSAGININFGASAGTVSGNVEGLLTAKYDNYLNAPGNANIAFQYAGILGESKLRTNLGANLKADLTFGVDFPWWTFLPNVNVGGTLLDSNPSIQSNTDFTYSYDSWTKGTAAFAPTIGSLGFDAVLAGVGVDLKVTQDVYFRPQGINGSLTYTHLGTGTSGLASFGAYDGGWVQTTVPLNLPGYWALTLTDLSLYDNSFYTDIGLDASINMWATILGKAEFSVGFDIYRSNQFALNFDDVDKLGGSFLVYVDQKGQPDSVPEPGTAWLLVSGLISLMGVRRD